MSFKYFNVKNGLTTGNISLHAANANVQANYFLGNINVTSSANLGAVGNVRINGGSSGYVLSTDGLGNLSWASQGSSNIVLDSFTGNGVQTDFTLSSTPSSEDYTIINIDGVSQLHSAYIVSGANVILSSAPASGAAIEVMTFNLSGGGGGGGSSGSNIANGTSNVSIATSGGNVTTSVAGNANVIVATGTGVNVAGYLTATGNITSGNANLGNSAVANYFTGTLTTNAQPNITSVGTLTSLNVSGNTTSGNFIGVFANGNSNINIPASNGNINLTAVGNTVMVITGTGANIAGTLNTGIGNANVGNLGTAQLLASANVTSPQLISNIATGTAPLVVTSTTRVSNLNVAYANVADYINLTTATTGTYYPIFANAVTGNVEELANTNLSYNAATSALSATLLTGTLTTAAQPNITSLGTIANLTATNINLTSFKETVIAGGNTSTSISPNVAAGTIFTYTANSNFTFSTLTNAVAGSSATIIITQASPGSFTLTSTMKFAGASKTLSTAAASIDIISVFYDGTTYYATLSKGYA